MIAEPNRRKKSALLSWWGLSQWKAMDSVYDGPPNFLFPLYNSVLLPLNGDLHLACQGCRLQSTTLLIFNKPIFAGELSGSLFLSSQHSKHASTLNHFSCVWLFVTMWTVVHKLLCPWDSPGKNTGVGCQAVLQEIFQTQGWTHVSYVSCAGRRFLPPVSPHCHFLRRILPTLLVLPKWGLLWILQASETLT